MKEAGKLGIRSSKSGKPICKSWMHRLLRDPFYTGKFIYGGRMYQGQHPPLLTDDEFNLLQDKEFADRKRALLLEKETITKQLTEQNPENLAWAEIGKDSFDFGQLAAKRFENNGSEDKRIIFKTVGSNPILLDQKLDFQLRPEFAVEIHQ